MTKLKVKNINWKIIVFGGTALLLICGGVAIVYNSIFKQVSYEYASNKCQEFSDEVKAQITAVPGYSIINERKSCNQTKDEFGRTDYLLEVEFRVSESGINSVVSARSSMDNLASKMPVENHRVLLDIIAAKGGKPETICVSAEKYIDNDGKFIPQASPGVVPRDVIDDKFAVSYPCYDLY